MFSFKPVVFFSFRNDSLLLSASSFFSFCETFFSLKYPTAWLQNVAKDVWEKGENKEIPLTLFATTQRVKNDRVVK